MRGIVGRKVGMSSLWNSDGVVIPCTLIDCGGCKVVQIKTNDVDGYSAVQIGYGVKKEKNVSKSFRAHCKHNKCDVLLKIIECRDFDVDVNSGDNLNVTDLFSEGDFVDVVGRSKGKGFQGVVKRHGFSGVGGTTHGQHNRLRAPGSVGASSFPSRVFKGLRMAGRMGGERVTVKNLEILKIDGNVVVVAGCVPGSNNGIVFLQK